MKFTSADLMKAMGLSVGDRIKIDNKIFEIYISPQNELRCCNIHNLNNHFYLKNLIDKDYEILPRPKRVGDLKCGLKKEFGGTERCVNCPVRLLCGHSTCKNAGLGAGDTLYTYLETYKNDVYSYDEYDGESSGLSDFDEEIYNLIKARLDKEASE